MSDKTKIRLTLTDELVGRIDDLVAKLGTTQHNFLVMAVSAYTQMHENMLDNTGGLAETKNGLAETTPGLAETTQQPYAPVYTPKPHVPVTRAELEEPGDDATCDELIDQIVQVDQAYSEDVETRLREKQRFYDLKRRLREHREKVVSDEEFRKELLHLQDIATRRGGD